MRLLRVRLENVRGVDACEVVFAADGVTIVEAPNESGKTTLMEAIDILLEVKDSSTAQRVKDLQPSGRDVGSTIEVELRCGDIHLTCAKTYNKQRATTLHVHAPAAEQVTGAAAHDRLRTILGANVDLDLFAALRFDQGRDLRPVSFQDSSVLAARLDAVAGGTGNGDGDALLDLVDEEYARYFTPTGRDGRTLTEVDDRVDALRATHEQLTVRVDALAEDVDELAGISSELPALQRRQTEEIEPRLAELRRQLTSISRHEGLVETRTAERDHAAAAQAAAGRERADRHDRIAAVEELEQRVGSLSERLAPSRDRIERLQEQAAASEAQLTDAADVARDAREERDLAQARVDLLHARQELDQLTARHDRVRSVLAAAQEAEEALAGIVIDATSLAAIRAAEQDRKIAAATLAAGSPTVTVHPSRTMQVQIDGHSSELPMDRTWQTPVSDRFHLTIPDVVDIQVRAGGSAGELQSALSDATQLLAQQCLQAGVRDVEEAEHRAHQREVHEATLHERDEALERELHGSTPEQLAASLHEVQMRVSALVARLPDDPDDERTEPDEARQRLVKAREAAEAADERYTELRAVRDMVRERSATAREKVLGDEAALAHLTEQLERAQAALAQNRATMTDDDLEAKLTAATAHTEQAEAALEQARSQLQELDPEAVELDAQSWEQQRTDAQARARELGERRSALRTRLELSGEEGLGERHLQVEQELERACADQQRVRSRARAAQALHAALHTARDEAYEQYRRPLRDRIVDQARLLYRRSDVDVELGTDLEVVRRTLDGTTLDWTQLSAGAREQLAILSALAAAQLAGDDGVPFVLDDALGYTDPQRLERIGALLARTTDAQVIVLTCVADRFRHVGGATVVRLREAGGQPPDA